MDPSDRRASPVSLFSARGSTRSLQRATRARPTLIDPAASVAPLLGSVAVQPSDERPPTDMADVRSRLAPRLRAVEAPVTVAGERAAPSPPEAFRADVRAGCFERLAMLARHRDERPMGERPRIEGRMLAQLDALACAGAGVGTIAAFWEAEGQREPWLLWAALFTLSSIPGTDSLRAVLDILEALPEEGRELLGIAADALVVAPHPDLLVLARDLMRSPKATARAVGLDVTSRRGALSADAARASWGDPSPVVAAMAVRALGRQGDPATLRAVLPLLAHGDADVAWEAARALTIRGDVTALLEVRDGGALAARLGARALEILVLGGRLDDLGGVQALVRRVPISADVLSAVGRFGHPGSWAFLVHHLADPELEAPAARALETTFGPLVPERESENPSAWRDALAEAGIAQGVRLRRGKPWSTEVIEAECSSGLLTRRETEVRADELMAHRVKATPTDFGAWGLRS